MPRRPEASDYFAPPPVAAPRGRLTDQQRAERAMKEIDLQRQLVGTGGIAGLFGWESLHIRAGMRAGGQWRTATSGSMAVFPDLILVRERDRRLIFAELKRELEQPTPAQERTLGVLRSLAGQFVEPLRAPVAQGDLVDLRIDVVVWRPSDFRDPFDESPGGRLLR